MYGDHKNGRIERARGTEDLDHRETGYTIGVPLRTIACYPVSTGIGGGTLPTHSFLVS